MSMRHHNIFRHREFTSFLRARLLPHPNLSFPYSPPHHRCPSSIPLPPLPSLPLLSNTPPTLPPLPTAAHAPDQLILISSPLPLRTSLPVNTSTPQATTLLFSKTTPPSTRKRPRDSSDSLDRPTKRRTSIPKFSQHGASPTAVANVPPQITQTSHRKPRPTNHTLIITRSSSESEGVDENSSPGFNCNLCTATFLRKHHLERHIQNIHEGQRPWTCEICGFAFHQKPNLERHIMTVHEEQRPYRCNVCKMSFGRKGVLKKHVQMVHEHSRKFECDICKISFGLKSDLKRHVQSVHQKKRPFVCQVCSASFGRKSDLKRHTLSLHPGAQLPSKKTPPASSAPNTS